MKIKIVLSNCLWFFFIFLFSCNNTKKEIIVYPKHFTGYSVIFYSQKKGAETYEFSKGNIVLKLNSNVSFVDYNSNLYEDVIVKFDDSITNKSVRSHSGTIFVPDRVDYLVHYVDNDSLYLKFDDLKKIYKKHSSR